MLFFTWLKCLTWTSPPLVSSSILPLLAQHTLFHRVLIFLARFGVHASARPQWPHVSGLYKILQKDRDSDSVPHFPLGKTVPDSATNNSIPVLLVGAEVSYRHFPSILGVPCFPRQPKHASCGQNSWPFLGTRIFLTCIWEGLCAMSVKTALHPDINPYIGKKGDRWSLLPRVMKHRMQMIWNN